jgi:hypothetical protein
MKGRPSHNAVSGAHYRYQQHCYLYPWGIGADLVDCKSGRGFAAAMKSGAGCNPQLLCNLQVLRKHHVSGMSLQYIVLADDNRVEL